jgi:hypothetical protein
VRTATIAPVFDFVMVVGCVFCGLFVKNVFEQKNLSIDNDVSRSFDEILPRWKALHPAI